MQPSHALTWSGACAKDLGTKSRQEMMKFLGCKVHLFLKVKLVKGWTEGNANMYERLGLDFNA